MNAGARLAAAAILLLLPACTARPASPARVASPRALEVSSRERVVVARGTIFPARYNTHPQRANGHHAIVWKGGGAAGKALIELDVPDADLQDALEKLGGEPGDNLTRATWERRGDPASPAPDLRVKGTRVRVSLSWKGRKDFVPLADVLAVEGGASIEPRLGGHRALIPVWRSGCVLCLFSCPGGRMSNAGATIRDQARSRVRFFAREDRLPADGSRVRVRFELVTE